MGMLTGQKGRSELMLAAFPVIFHGGVGAGSLNQDHSGHKQPQRISAERKTQKTLKLKPCCAHVGCSLNSLTGVI